MKLDEASVFLPARPRRRRSSRSGAQVSASIARAVPSVGRGVLVWVALYAFVSPLDSVPRSLAVAGGFALIWVMLLACARSAYEHSVGALGTLSATTLGAFGGLFAVSSIGSWLHVLDIGLLKMLAIAGSVFVLILAWETFVLHALPARRRLLIVGRTESARELAHELATYERHRFEVLGAIDDGAGNDILLDVPILGDVDRLANTIKEVGPDLVVVCAERNRPEVFGQLLEAAESGFKLIGLPEFYEFAFGRVPVRHLSAAWFMSVLHLYQHSYTRFTKRSFDVVVASFGLLLSSPLMLIVALLVKRTPGPVIFRQVRLGEGGRHFTILKFRTMRENAEEPGHPVWASKNDPRVTSLGRALRKTRLDELPQLWNVLRGDMSIVGPRPERPEFVRVIEAAVPFWSRRHLLKPGITGWAQVCRGYAADTDSTEEKLSYDLWYLRHRSLLVDLLICAKTAARLFPATSGAH